MLPKASLPADKRKAWPSKLKAHTEKNGDFFISYSLETGVLKFLKPHWSGVSFGEFDSDMSDSESNNEEELHTTKIQHPLVAKPMDRDVAIIGMSCRFPGNVEGPAALWTTLTKGRCAVGKVPFCRWD